jgi:hypothetical protein
METIVKDLTMPDKPDEFVADRELANSLSDMCAITDAPGADRIVTITARWLAALDEIDRLRARLDTATSFKILPQYQPAPILSDRQRFIDAAVVGLLSSAGSMTSGELERCFEWADRIWSERERRRLAFEAGEKQHNQENEP